MKREQVLNQLTTPIGAPAFPRGPFRFTNREYLNILYRTDIDALRAVVPEPLERSAGALGNHAHARYVGPW